ncbi:MAG: hypothetical protein JF886_14195 [Candidatus Dormibacteraeota bacterium]|uniref:Uncharacterized protein n=1 Tax=Candidatus Aeolococcus gillhamiae TaxID=3127015 RepID=A0A934JZ34_9BACT|nr:hypothetical protein [Candidatus Dormibacteraeota bacterium]
MPEVAVIVFVLVVPLAGFVALQRAGAFIVAEEAAILRVQRRLAHERHRTLDRLPGRSIVRRLDEFRDLRRLLLVAGDDRTPGTWALRLVGGMLLVFGGLIVINLLTVAAGDGVTIAWQAVLLLVLAVPVLGLLRLRLRAARTRASAGRAFAEVAAVLAAVGGRPPLRNPAQLEPTDLVAMVATWIDDPALRAITAGNRWRRLNDEAHSLPTSEATWFQRIGELYEIPAAVRVGEVVRVSREANPKDVSARYLRTARDLSRERLADLRARNRRAMVTQVVPMLGLVAALLILVLSAVAAIHLGGS